MEALCIVCTVDPAFTASVESKICPFTIAIFLKYSNGMPAGRAPAGGGGQWLQGKSSLGLVTCSIGSKEGGCRSAELGAVRAPASRWSEVGHGPE